MPRSSIRGGRNNNPTGRNQYSNGGIMERARERPVAAAAVAAGTAAAGLFLWSRRNQISDQISQLSDQFSEWRSGNGSMEFESTGSDASGASMNIGTQSRSGASGSSRSRSTGKAAGMSETGGGNASLGRQSGGAGIKSNASSRGRARGIPSTT
jgi:hypothetical protein